MLSIKHCGTFQDFASPQNLPEFRRYNAIYGFNGSGKSTFTRILSSLQQTTRPSRLPAQAEFAIEFSDGTVVRSGTPQGSTRSLIVFNVDFVDENLRWEEGTARPVFYLGKAQADISREIDMLESAVIDLETAAKQAAKDRKHADWMFTTHKRDVAREIGEALGLARTYDARDLDKDYSSLGLGSSCILPVEQEATQRAILAQGEPLAKRRQLDAEPFNLERVTRDAMAALSTEIADLSIEALLDHGDMIPWVREGADYHRERKLGACLLCGGPLNDGHLELIKVSLNEKLDQLVGAAAEATETVRQLRDRLTTAQALRPSPNDISQESRIAFELAASSLDVHVGRGKSYLEQLEEALNTKSTNPSRTIDLDSLVSTDDARGWDAGANEAVVGVNAALESHNSAHDDFAQRKEAARLKLKSHFLATHNEEYRALRDQLGVAEREVQRIDAQLDAKRQRLTQLKQDIRQHGPAADKINSMIHAYLGHGELQIAAVDEGYELYRHGSLVDGAVSEGEKTAIALCYFLSTVEAEGRRLGDSIVVIDDPISSLDTMALNYAFNLIKSSLSESAQLILLTHNLQFMNEIRKWLKNKTEKDPPTAALFFLETKQNTADGRRFTHLVRLPKLLREYESEYHYLFSRVLEFSRSPSESEYLYLIPNAMRKLLDIFLAFKSPGSDGLASKIERIAVKTTDIDPARVRALDRLVQAESHADNIEAVSTLPSLTVEETSAAGLALLDLIRALDKDHYEWMCKLCRPDTPEDSTRAQGAGA